jgi:hypothetical protein
MTPASRNGYVATKLLRRQLIATIPQPHINKEPGPALLLLALFVRSLVWCHALAGSSNTLSAALTLCLGCTEGQRLLRRSKDADNITHANCSAR